MKISALLLVDVLTATVLCTYALLVYKDLLSLLLVTLASLLSLFPTFLCYLRFYSVLH